MFSKKQWFVVTLLFIVLCQVCCATTYKTTELLFPDTRKDINALTTPLEPIVVQDLCSKLDLPDDDTRCQPGVSTYATDFFRDIDRPFEYGITTYDDVHALFGEYEFRCEPRVTQADGYSYFRCSYDFNGDRMYWVTFRFSGDEAVLDLVLLHVVDSP